MTSGLEYEFWKWFINNCDKLHPDKYDLTTIKELDRRIIDLNFRWEIGPGINKKYSLSISPNGLRENIERVKAFVNEAPYIEEWEYFNYKQPKSNWHQLEVPTYNLKLSALDWQYALLKYKDDKKEILIKGDSLSALDKDLRNEMAEIVLFNLLGEEIMMTEIDFIDVLDPKDNSYEMNKISELRKHLVNLKSGKKFEQT